MENYLSKEKEIILLDLPGKDMKLALMMFDNGFSVYLIDEQMDGYDLAYVLN